VFVLAVILRLVPVVLLGDMGIGLDDMFQYDMLARSLVSGDGFRWYAEPDLELVQAYLPVDFSMEGYDPRGVLTSFRPPLYPVFLSFIYFLSGVNADRFFIARLVQCFLNALLVPLTYAIARSLFPNRIKTARISAWIVALYPMMVIYPMALATENLFFLLLLVSFLVLLKAAESKKIIWFIICGITLGLTALTRSVALAFAGLCCLWVWLCLREWKRALLLFFLVAIITAPWMIRNTVLHGRLTGIESGLGYDLYLGYHPEGTGTFQYGISLDLIPMFDDGERDELGQQLAWNFIKDDPGRIPYLIIRRLGYFFGLERRALSYFYSNNFFGYIPAPWLLIISIILLLPFMIISTSAMIGFALASRRKETILLALLFIGYITPHALILGEDRFHLTLVPFLAILAAHFWSSGLNAIRSRMSSPWGMAAVSLSLVAVVLLCINWGLEIYRDWGLLTQLFGVGGNQLHLPY
jgi:4-amino-4-deoxy-L-arabinose transferase-like glycosyltransferase